MSRPSESPAEIRGLPLRPRTEWLRRRFGLRPRQALGQNFLVNEGAARRLAEAAVEPGLPLLEVGGGLGALSVPLAESGLPLTVVEIDEKAAEALDWLVGDLAHVRVVCADILQVDLRTLAKGAAPAAQASLSVQRAGWAQAGEDTCPTNTGGASGARVTAEGGQAGSLPYAGAEAGNLLQEGGQAGSLPYASGQAGSPPHASGQAGSLPYAGTASKPCGIAEGEVAATPERSAGAVSPSGFRLSTFDLRLPPSASPLLTAVGNLPYSSGGAILQRLWAPDSPCGRIVVTVQREVAERLRAEPGSKAWGPLSVLAALHTEGTRIIARLSPESFVPAPKVESTALVMERRRTPPAGLPNWEAVGRALRGAFGTRRKTLSNSLRFALQLAPAQVTGILNRAGLDGRRRGETLSLEELLALARALREN